MSSTDLSTPSLTLVGVGPGDPDLLTVAAVKAIESATVVAYPVSRQGGEGVAHQIALRWISSEQKTLPLLFPMVYDIKICQEAWREAGSQLVALVEKGMRVVVLCEGDVSLFSTSSYLLLELNIRHPNCPVRLVPGVTSFSAAAATGFWPLPLRNEQLLILPTPDEPIKLKQLLVEASASNRVLALLKLGHRWVWVRPLLEELNLLNMTLFAQRIGWPDQEVKSAVDVLATTKPYFSLLLIRQGWPEGIL